MRVFVTLSGTGRGILTLCSAFGLEADHEAGKALLATLEKKLEAYEVILSKQKYLAGDDVTLADLFHVPRGCEYLVGTLLRQHPPIF